MRSASGISVSWVYEAPSRREPKPVMYAVENAVRNAPWRASAHRVPQCTAAPATTRRDVPHRWSVRNGPCPASVVWRSACLGDGAVICSGGGEAGGEFPGRVGLAGVRLPRDQLAARQRPMAAADFSFRCAHRRPASPSEVRRDLQTNDHAGQTKQQRRLARGAVVHCATMSYLPLKRTLIESCRASSFGRLMYDH